MKEKETNVKNFQIDNNNYFKKIIILLYFFIWCFYIHYYYSEKKIISIKFYNKIIEQNMFYEMLTNFTSYSQFYEDLILFAIFFDIKKGFYVDIGANDPNHISVTKAFYLRGWNGLNIEPLPKMHKKLNKYRKRDINLKIGVGEKKGKEILIDKGTGSTLKKYNSKRHGNKLIINIYTMKYILNKYVPKNETIHFCKIDIEGGEKNALLGYDFENYRPKVFCIESTKPGTNIPCHEEWEYLLIENDYSFVYKYKINRFYIDNRISGLRERFMLSRNSIKIISKKKYK